MDPFEFVIIIVLIVSLTKAGSALMTPIASRIGDLIGEMAQERRARRERLPRAADYDDEAIAHIERRLARIEDRLDFLEELRKPDDRTALPGSDREG